MLMTAKNDHSEGGSLHHFRQDLENLTPNAGAEMLRYGWKKPDILSLGQGEGCATTPDFIADAARTAMQDGKTFYAPVLGFPGVRQELSNYYKSIYNLDIPTNRLFLTGSGTTAMHLALTSILDVDDEILAVTPIWKNLLGAAEVSRAVVNQVSLELKDNKWHLDLEKLFAAVTPNTKAILIVSPSNPTGWMMSDADIKTVLEFAREKNLWIIADEVYGRIVYNDKKHAPSFLSHAKPDDKLYIVNSFSKAYAMTGWRLGWLVGPAYSEEVIRDIALYDNMGPASFIQLAGGTALKDGEPFIAEQLSRWRKNRDILRSFFAAHPQLECPEIDATFYAFFQHKDKPDCMAFCRQLIDDVSLSLAPGCAFGKSSKSFVRFCFACSEPKLLEALDRLEKAV